MSNSTKVAVFLAGIVYFGTSLHNFSQAKTVPVDDGVPAFSNAIAASGTAGTLVMQQYVAPGEVFAKGIDLAIYKIISQGGACFTYHA